MSKYDIGRMKDFVTAFKKAKVQEDGTIYLTPEARTAITKTLTKELKRMTPVKPVEKGNDVWCGKCGAYMETATAASFSITRHVHKYCQLCGNAVDWTDYELRGDGE